jgi:hypothetical protein
MFDKKYTTIIVVHNDEVFWISNDSTGGKPKILWLPLEQVLMDQEIARQMPEWLKDNTKPLCIFPDHWFGIESYPFQSKKPSLIEPFLERKLATAYPGQKEIQFYYNYRYVSHHGENRIFTIFLQDEKSYRFFEVLRRLNQTPQRITSPAFLWEERLQVNIDDFERIGMLLIHISGREGHLYFYYNGNYQFSRSVMLSDAADSLDALGFEINQSLYLFSQKAKRDLDRMGLICDAPDCQARLMETLGREVIDLTCLAAQWPEIAAIAEMKPLNGLLHLSQMNKGASFFSVIHRQLKRTMQWWPVQLTGMIVGLILLLCLIGENFMLRNMLHKETLQYRSIQQLMATDNPGTVLTEHTAILDQVLDRAARSSLVDTVFRFPHDFPTQIHLRELDLALESTPSLKLTAMVQARNPEELTVVLNRLIARIKAVFKGAQAFSFNDIDIRLDYPGGEQAPNRYLIAFQLELI